MVDGDAVPLWRREAERAFALGRAAHPGLALPLDPFAEHAAACARRRLARQGKEATEEALAVEVGSGHPADLFLAAAALARAAGAWERLQASHAQGLAALAASRGADAATAEQKVAELWSDLAVAPAGSGRAPPLSQYDGSGRLFSWLATCLLRRTAAREGPARKPLPVEPPAPLQGAGEDPAVAVERREFEAALTAAVRRAVGALAPQERAALVLCHRDGWSGKEVARILAVGEPRVSRLRTRATEKVRGALLPLLRGRAPGGLRALADGSWTALRDAVAAALAAVAIPAGKPAPFREDPPVRRSPHG